MLVKFSLLCSFWLFFAFSGAYGQNASAVQKFFKQSEIQKTLKAKGQTVSPSQPLVKVHFYWTSWCEFCDDAYRSLVSLDEDERIKGKIQMSGYCLDESINDKVREKLKIMNRIDQYLLPANVIKEHQELARLPAFVVEDVKTGRLEAYTGFNNERFLYLKKNVLRILKSEPSDE